MYVVLVHVYCFFQAEIEEEKKTHTTTIENSSAEPWCLEKTKETQIKSQK